ncbi:hypothetical protein PR048_019917 [Dryococelus australis]|uniref:Uncharacterized protein n=1 Tax=Dryococelus australis TaxID=614101 RepID=A0ABQ9H4W8_9NEOP|nr:hypothetical protein PR048_019917 [Dryococelus australis]
MNQVIQKKRTMVFTYVVYRWMSKKKRMWVHPYINARLLKGAFVTRRNLIGRNQIKGCYNTSRNVGDYVKESVL